MSAWVSWEAILWMTFFNGNLCFCLQYSRAITGQNSGSNQPLPLADYIFLLQLSELWPLIHLKCSCWVLFCLLLWFSEYFLFHFFFPFPLPFHSLLYLILLLTVRSASPWRSFTPFSPPSFSSQVSYLGTLI